MTDLQKAILDALDDGPRTCGSVGEAVGLDPFRARAWLETLRDIGEVVTVSGGRYKLPDDKPNPGPEAA